MEEKLNLSLPEKKQKGMGSSVLRILLLLIIAVLAAANLYVSVNRNTAAAVDEMNQLSVEQTKQLATKLAQRNLYEQAAEVWEDYLATGSVSDIERAKALFQIGTLLEKVQQYGRAIEFFYRSELAASVGELEPQINSHIKNCFERLGKFSAMRYEMMDRTSITQADSAGSKVVAEIGAEKITEADLDGIIEGGIENQLSGVAAFMTAEELNEQKKRMLQQYKSGQARGQFLQSWLAQEILYRQALEQQISEKSSVKKSLDDLVRGFLSQQMMTQELAANIHITETDLKTFYETNKSQYLDPAKASISHILLADEQGAKDVMERVKSGGEFVELAKEFSKDESTRNNGGKLSVEVEKGSNVAGIGDYAELNDKIFAAKATEVLTEPFKTEKGWEIVKVDQTIPERQRLFDEVRQEVMSTLLQQKRQDVQQQYIRQMMDKYGVIIHHSVLTGTSEQMPSE